VANTTDDYTIVEATNVNGITEASEGECALKGLHIDAVKDNVHITLK
jgi:hypothetical protein